MKTSYFIKSFLGTLLFFSLLFISAGRFNYYQGILYVIIGLIILVLNNTLFKIDTELIIERSKPGENTKKWDKFILFCSLIFTLSMYVIAGLDSGRYLWSPNFHWGLNVLGVLLTASGQLLFLIAQKQNKFFSSTVRIQTERNHSVCETGLYKIVRHPAYLGSIIQALGFPLLFGSIWTIFPVILLISLFITRTYLEDKTLNNELNGYTLYCSKTPYKIIPYIW